MDQQEQEQDQKSKYEVMEIENPTFSDILDMLPRLNSGVITFSSLVIGVDNLDAHGAEIINWWRNKYPQSSVGDLKDRLVSIIAFILGGYEPEEKGREILAWWQDKYGDRPVSELKESALAAIWWMTLLVAARNTTAQSIQGV